MEPKHIPIQARPNDLSKQERLVSEQQQRTFGHTQSAEWVNPKARFIFRCSACLPPLNSNGIERSVKAHIRKSRKNIIEPVIVTVARPNSNKFQFAIPAKLTQQKRGRPKTARRQNSLAGGGNREQKLHKRGKLAGGHRI